MHPLVGLIDRVPLCLSLTARVRRYYEHCRCSGASSRIVHWLTADLQDDRQGGATVYLYYLDRVVFNRTSLAVDAQRNPCVSILISGVPAQLVTYPPLAGLRVSLDKMKIESLRLLEICVITEAMVSSL